LKLFAFFSVWVVEASISMNVVGRKTFMLRRAQHERLKNSGYAEKSFALSPSTPFILRLSKENGAQDRLVEGRFAEPKA
jgi:hypothetical protein